MERAFELVSEALRDGQLVCIFPEGRITDNGELYPFRPGLTRVLERDPVPVIPVRATLPDYTGPDIGWPPGWAGLWTRRHVMPSPPINLTGEPELR